MRLWRSFFSSFFLFIILFVYKSDGQNYILKQGVDESGNVFIYSPYILWNNQINPSPSTLKSPLQIYSARGQLNVTLTVEVTRVSNELFSFNTRTFCYSDICALPGPSLYVTPGDRLTIRVVNKLGNSSAAKTASNIPAFSEETFFPNRTNVFIQGVPLDPSVNSPFTYIEGGDPIYTYSHVIPDDVIPGVHWYHSRVHKLAAFQVLNGLLGAFFIIPRNTTIYPSSYTQLEHQTLVFTHLLLEEPNNIYIDETTSNGFSYLDDEFFSSSLSLKYLSSAYGSNLPLKIAYTNRFTFQNNPKNFTVPIFDAWFTNGQYQPVMTLAPGKWKIFDIVIASGDRMIELELKDTVGNAGVGNYVCTMSLIAKNGVQYQTPRTGTYIRHLTLFPSETASILLMCPTAGTYYLQTSSFISANTSTASSGLGQIGDYQLKSSQLLLILNITGDFFVMDDPPSDFSFIPNSIPDQGTSQYLNSNSSVYAPEGPNSIDLSISTIQDRPLPSGSSLSQAVNCYQLNDSNTDLLPFGSDAEYLLGMGSDCQLPCYDDILCTALYGSSNFQLDQFPTVLNSKCFYASSSKDQVGTNGMNCNNSVNATNDPIQDSYPGIYRLQKGYDINYIQDDTLLVNLEIYGHRDFQYPMFFQSQFSQYHSFENVNLNIANIILRDDYYPLNSLSPGYYYQTNDWQYFLLPTPGRSFFTTKINFDNNPNGIIYLLSSVLKFEDRGFLRVIEFQPTVKPPTPVPAPTPSPTPVSPNPLATTITPWSIRNSLDKANASFLCDVTGQSFYYNETIDFAQRVRIIQINSCPNHFSVCQSMECGGAVKTRALQNAQTFLVPLYPHLRKVPIDMSCSDDLPTAIALNGVKIYSPAEEEKQACHSYPPSQYNDDLLYGRTACQNPSRYPGIIQCGNRLKTVATIVDKCGGFSDITYTQGEYRYHMLPTCLYNQLEQLPQSNASVGNGRNITWISSQGSSSIRGGRRKHSPQIAWSLDGFPVYGPYGAKGILMRRCGSIGAHPQICVDVCNGYYGRLPDVDQYYYRYYILGNISTSSQCSSTIQNVYGNGGGLNAGKCQRLQSKCCANAIPDSSFFPYVPTCFRGCLINQTNNAYLCNSVADFDEDTVYETSKGYSDYFIPAVSSYAKSIVSDNLTAIDAMFSSSTTTENEVSSPESNNNTNVTTDDNGDNVVNTRRVLTVNELEQQFMLISTNLSNSISPVTVKYFQRNRDDFYITGMTFDTNHQNLFFTSQSSIFSYNLQNQVLTKVISGIIEVDIFGYNFGNQRSDIEYVRLNQSYDCTSIIRFNATNLRCLFYQPGALTLYYQYNRTIPPALIEIRTISGVARGIALDAMNIVRGNIMRPVMTGMTSKKYPFCPYALKMHGNTLYWTNIANDARSIQRSFSDGSSIETIVTNVKKGSSIDVMDAYLDYNLNFFSLSPPTIENVTIVQASGDYPTTSLSTSYDDIYEGHIIFVSDYDQGEVVQVNVLPINSNAYVFALDPLPPITTNITFDPTTNTTSGVRSTELLSILQYQDTSDISAAINAIPMTVLLTDVIKVKNVYIDLTTSEFYLVMSQGLILRSDLISILTSQLIQQRNLNTVIEQINWPVSIPVTSLLINQRVALDAYGDATSAWSSLLPWWWKIVYIGTSDSRLTGFTTIPASLVPPRFAINSTNFWNIRRLFVLDCNQERLIDILQNAFDSSLLAIGQKFDVHWPQVLLFSQAMTLSSSSLNQGIELYLSEYLGKIWKLTVQLNTVTGLIDYRYTIPELVLDVSTFTTSILLRNELNDNSNTIDSLNSNQIFYEVSV